MGAESSIEWTDATANFWRGCDKVSPGCAECYMFRDQRRYGRDPTVVVRCSPATFYAPLRSSKWRDKAAGIAESEGRRMRVFTCSWSDFFHEDADEWRDDAWDVIRQCPDYDWQILTKRPELIADRLPDDWGDGCPHVWLGVSIENRRFVGRADVLRQVPAAVRFVSAEPLLGPLVEVVAKTYTRGLTGGSWGAPRIEWGGLDLTGIDWLIAGGESGGRPGRALVERVDGIWTPKPAAVEWVRNLRDACAASRCPECGGSGQWVRESWLRADCPDCGGSGGGTEFLLKQWGGPRPESGGRLLDGRTYDWFPESPAAP